MHLFVFANFATEPVSMDKMTTAKPVSPEPVSVPVPYSQNTTEFDKFCS